MLSHLISINTRTALKLSLPCSIKWLSPANKSSIPPWNREEKGIRDWTTVALDKAENALCLCFKTRLHEKPFIRNEFDLHGNEPVFGRNGFVRKTRFDMEAKGNSEIACIIIVSSIWKTHMGRGGSVTGFLLHPTARIARRRG